MYYLTSQDLHYLLPLISYLSTYLPLHLLVYSQVLPFYLAVLFGVFLHKEESNNVSILSNGKIGSSFNQLVGNNYPLKRVIQDLVYRRSGSSLERQIELLY